jgi:hypothetical protein
MKVCGYWTTGDMSLKLRSVIKKEKGTVRRPRRRIGKQYT